jgi:2,4-dienoyl-CoA reductase-like NADH-dependent reductase (Old Yellow Enzyme family)
MAHAGGPSWDVEQTLRLAKLLPALGVDLLDVSSGGNNAAQKLQLHPYYQVSIAGRIRETVRAEGLPLLIGAVGMITEAEMARNIVQVDGAAPKQQQQEQQGGQKLDQDLKAESPEKEKTSTVEIEDEHGKTAQADVVLAARQFLREPNWVLQVAAELGVKVKNANQYHRINVKGRAKI